MKPAIPDDFPRTSIPGVVAGFQDKITARKIDGKYIVGLTEEEILGRYIICEDLAQQLAQYCLRKATENPDWTQDFNFNRAIAAVTNKVERGVWRFSDDEQGWIAERTKKILGW